MIHVSLLGRVQKQVRRAGGVSPLILHPGENQGTDAPARLGSYSWTRPYVLDEHLRKGALWQAIQRHNAAGIFLIDVVQVGDPVDLPLGSTDPDILLWAEKEDRLVVTRDYNTMLNYLAAHLQAGHHCAGLFLIRPKATIRQIVDYLVATAYAADPTVLRDCYEYIP